ncbi:GNAT family N-acetyltransferase [Agrococcus sp. ARC_14]|uniref:GNAT family N-acetyltransferase n=1 Tax=Agrococcus sp. ARC_14 TaxID=2919927 RepID=UPI001F056113|nr:GNAT family N-acetyltransferase [Agrococcus sp. ARC_14]MCH1884053.1 N-acetyltransferase [Agrococcus sp. ARC_14]
MSEQAGQTHVVVGDDSDRGRYEAHIGDHLAGVLSYVDDADGNRVLQHTVVGDEYGGHGVGSALAVFALQDAADAERKIVPQCTFVQGWLERHPEHQPLVAHAYEG